MKASFVPEENEPREHRGPWPGEPPGPQLLRTASAGRTPSLAPKVHAGLVPTPCHGSGPWEEGLATCTSMFALHQGRNPDSERLSSPLKITQQATARTRT